MGERSGKLVGFACYGQVPLTQGTYGLYWIVVHPQVQHADIGPRMLEAVEADIPARGGHQLLIETSGRADYEAARRLY